MSEALIWTARAKTYVQTSERMTWLWARDGLTLAGLTGKLEKPAKLLDVACGPGRLAMAAAEMGYEVTATDFSEGMLARAKERAAAAGLSIATHATDGQTLEGLPDNTFDAVTSTFGLFHFPDRVAGWHSVLRVLKPGGRVMAAVWVPTTAFPGIGKYIMSHAENFVGVPDSTSANQPHGHSHAHPAHFPEATEMAQEMTDCGFVDPAVFEVHHDVCFSSGKEVAETHIPEALVSNEMNGKDSRSVKICLMHYIDLVSQGVHPLTDPDAPLPPKIADGVVAEEMKYWSKPVVIPTCAHIAIASKPM